MSNYDLNLVFLIVWASLAVLSILSFLVSKIVVGSKMTKTTKNAWATAIYVCLAGFAFSGIVVLASTILMGKESSGLFT